MATSLTLTIYKVQTVKKITLLRNNKSQCPRYNILYFYSRIGRKNLVLRFSVPYEPNLIFETLAGIAWVAELNAAYCHVTRATKRNILLLEWNQTHNRRVHSQILK